MVDLGKLDFGAYQVLWSVGLIQITPGNSALIIAAGPVWTMIVGLERRATEASAPSWRCWGRGRDHGRTRALARGVNPRERADVGGVLAVGGVYGGLDPEAVAGRPAAGNRPGGVGRNLFLLPFGALLLGAWLVGEPVGPAQLVGGAVIALGVWLSRRRTIPPAGVRRLVAA